MQALKLEMNMVNTQEIVDKVNQGLKLRATTMTKLTKDEIRLQSAIRIREHYKKFNLLQPDLKISDAAAKSWIESRGSLRDGDEILLSQEQANNINGLLRGQS